MRLLLLTAIVVATLFDLGESVDGQAANRSNSRYAAPINYQPRESETLHRTGQVAECLRSILRNHRGLRMARSTDSPMSLVECLKLMVRGQRLNATQVLPLKKEVRVEKTIRAEVNPKRKQKCIHRVLVPGDILGRQKQTDSSDMYGQKIQATSRTGEAANKVETQAVRVPNDGVRVFAPQPAEARISAGPEQHQGRDVPASAESHEDPAESGEFVHDEEHQDSDEQLQTPVKPVDGQRPKLAAADQVKFIPVQVKSSADKASAVIDERQFDQKSAVPEQHPAAQTKGEVVQGRDVPASAESNEDPDESGELVNEEEHQDSNEQQQTPVKPVADQRPKLVAADQVKSILAVAVKDPKISHEQHEDAAAFRLAAPGQVHSAKIVADVKGASAESKEETHSAESAEVKQDPDESQESAENVQADDRSAESQINRERHDEHKPAAADQVHSAESSSHEAADESAGQSAEVESKEEAAQQQPAPSSDRVSEDHPSAEDRSTEADDRASGEERGESVEESDRSKEAADGQEEPQHHEGAGDFRGHKPEAADQVHSAESSSHEAADESAGSSAEEADSKESNDETVEQHTPQVAQQPAPSSDRVSEDHPSAEDHSTEADDQEETPHSTHDSERPSEEHKSAEETEAHDESSREEHGESAEEPAPHATRASKDSVERVDQQSGEDHSKEATHDAATSEERSESGEESGPSREAADSQEHDAATSGSHSAEKASPPAPQMSKEPASAEESASNQESAESAHDDSSQDEADSEEHDRVVQGQAKLKEAVEPDQKRARKEDHPEALTKVEGRHSASSAGKPINIEHLKEQLTESFGTSAETIEDERSAEDAEDQSHEFRTGIGSDEEASAEGHSVINKPLAVKPVHRVVNSEHSAEVADPVAVKPATSSVKQMAHIQELVPTLVSRLKIKPLPREVAPSVSNFCIVGKLYVAAQGAVAEQCKVCSAFFQCLGSQQAVNLCRRRDDTSSAESSELDQSGEQRAKKVKVRQSTIIDYVRTITDSDEWNEYLTDEVGTSLSQEANDWGRSGKNCYNRFGSVKGCMTPYLCLGYVYP